jgi:hypothetical protein
MFTDVLSIQGHMDRGREQVGWPISRCVAGRTVTRTRNFGINLANSGKMSEIFGMEVSNPE